jgi:hypothetical protein
MKYAFYVKFKNSGAVEVVTVSAQNLTAAYENFYMEMKEFAEESFSVRSVDFLGK